MKQMDEYEPTKAGRLIEEFVDEHLSNWYVRLSRSSSGKGNMSRTKFRPIKLCMNAWKR